MEMFPVFSGSRIFAAETATSLVLQGCKRVEKSGVERFLNEMKAGSMGHSELELGTCIGQGSFSSVFKVVAVRPSNTSDAPFAAEEVIVKVLGPQATTDGKLFAVCASDLVKEGILLSSLNHTNIVRTHAIAHDGMAAYTSGRHDAFFLVMDRLEEMLDDRIAAWRKARRQSQFALPSSSKAMEKSSILKKKTNAILELADAIEYIHSRGVVHRDLKPENIGVTKAGVLKLFDFDIACVLPESRDPDETFRLTRRIGSPRYMSPECALGKAYNEKTDLYAFGLLCHEILTLEKPYHDVLPANHEKVVLIGGKRPNIPSSWTSDMKRLVKSCWATEITSRPTMIEARETLEKALPKFMVHKQTSSKSRLFRRTKSTIPQ